MNEHRVPTQQMRTIRRGRGDGGFTLIELKASLTILAVGILAAARVMDSAFLVAGQGGNRTRAIAMATKETEALRAIPYDQLGFTVDQAGYVGTFEGKTTVTLVLAAPQVQPTGPTTVVNGISYSFSRYIVWTNPTSQATGAVCSSGYKRVTVLVGWTDHGGNHTARQDSYVYPGGLGSCGSILTTTTAPTYTSSQCSPPTNVSAVAGPIDTSTTVTLTWVAPVLPPAPIASYKIEYSTDNGLTWNLITSTQPATSLTYLASGMSPGTSYRFRVSSVLADGTSCAGVAAAATTTQQSTTTTSSTSTTTTTICVLNCSTTTTTTVAGGGTSGTCSVGSMTVTSNAILRSGPGATTLAASAVASVLTIGVCTGLRISYSPTKGVTTTAFLNVTNGGAMVATVDGTASWDTGTHLISVIDANAKTLATATFTVCTWNAKSCP
jgi:prepilin-type N-terminal cleavage/methylation domain-containing protein